MTLSIHVAGWTLVHFVWQGALVGLLAAGALWLLRSASAQTRYALACGALAAMLAAPIVTARLLSVAGRARAPIDAMLSVPAHDSTVHAPALLAAASPSRYGVSMHAARVGLDAILPLVVTAWSAGVALLLLRLAGGWWRVRRLHLGALVLASSRWQAMSDQLASHLGVHRRVHVVDSPRVDTPTVLGWLRPVVLLPIAALANLAPAQVEAILAHELAHVRRHDYVVNLLQTLGETLLFYHPAVWWVSSRIRAERENCCDDVAVNMCGDAVNYAAALTELETWRTARTALTLAATDGSLLTRVRRMLLGRVDDDGRSSAATVTVTVVLLSVMLVAGLPRLSASQPTTRRATVHPSPTVTTTEAREVPPLGPKTLDQDALDQLAVPPLQGIAIGGVLSAQTASSPAFDVASVKPHDPSSEHYCLLDIVLPARRMSAKACPLVNLIRYAYGLNSSQVVMPEPAVPGSFDILASFRDSSNLTRQEVLVMVQQLLADRFRLIAHHEQRPLPIYALVLARADGKLGKAMSPSSIDCEKWIAEGRSRTDEGVPSPLTPNHKRNACGIAPGPDFLVGGTATTAELASRLEVVVGRRVVDRTGLTGKFDFDLKFSRIPLTVPAANDAAAAPSDDAPLIFTAIQEQLGLKLEPTTAPLDVLVVDHVEHPTED